MAEVYRACKLKILLIFAGEGQILFSPIFAQIINFCSEAEIHVHEQVNALVLIP